MRTVLVSLCGLGLVAGLPGQGAGLRDRALGEVRTQMGAPWSGVEVVLFSRAIPDDEIVGEPDVVVTETDDRGQFRAAVSSGRPYSVWARAAADDGAVRLTQVVERVFAQVPVRLHERSAPLRSRTVRLTGVADWSGYGPLTARLIDDVGQHQVHQLSVQGDHITLPPVVGTRAWIEIFGKLPSGVLPILRADLGPEVGELALPPRVARVVWVRDLITRRPTVGAQLLRQLGTAMYLIGHTDAAGKGMVQLPADATVHVLADGYAMAVSSGQDPKIEALPMPDAAAPEDHFANLVPGREIHGQLLVGGQPVAMAWIRDRGAATRIYRPQGGTGLHSFARTSRTDELGRFVLRGLQNSNEPLSVHAVLDEEHRALLPAPWRAGLLPVVSVPLVAPSARGTEDDPVLVDLGEMCPTELVVRTADGAPAAFAGLGMRALEPDAWAPWQEGDLSTDRLGQLRLLMPSDADIGLRATHEESMSLRGFRTRGGGQHDGFARLVLPLDPPVSIRGNVVDKAGKALGGISVSVALSSNDGLEDWGYADGTDAWPAAGENAARWFVPANNRERYRLANLVSRVVEADSDGAFVMPMPRLRRLNLILVARRESVLFGHGVFLSTQHHLEWTGESVSPVMVLEGR